MQWRGILDLMVNRLGQRGTTHTDIVSTVDDIKRCLLRLGEATQARRVFPQLLCPVVSVVTL